MCFTVRTFFVIVFIPRQNIFVVYMSPVKANCLIPTETCCRKILCIQLYRVFHLRSTVIARGGFNSTHSSCRPSYGSGVEGVSVAGVVAGEGNRRTRIRTRDQENREEGTLSRVTRCCNTGLFCQSPCGIRASGVPSGPRLYAIKYFYFIIVSKFSAFRKRILLLQFLLYTTAHLCFLNAFFMSE